MGALGVQMLLKQKHEVVHLGPRAPPVVGREGIEGQRGNPESGRRLHCASDRRRAGDMTFLSGPTSPQCPTAVAIHVDGDVESVASALAGWFGLQPSCLRAASCHAHTSASFISQSYWCGALLSGATP